jgi:membrane associated rhomboid family serine protease
MTDPGREQRVPIFNAPTVVVALLAVLALVHLLRVLLPAEVTEWFTLALAFVPLRYADDLSGDVPGGILAAVFSPLTHALLHGDVVHLAINGAWLLAFGSALARRVGAARFLVLFSASAVAGALMYYAINGPIAAVLVGASGAISGLVGGAFRFFFRALHLARYHPLGLEGACRDVPRAPLSECVRDPQTRLAIIIWLVVNMITAVLLPQLGGGEAIAWEAHLGGFLFGLLAFALFDPPHGVPAPPAADDPGVTLH